jgi:beta-lactamase class A
MLRIDQRKDRRIRWFLLCTLFAAGMATGVFIDRFWVDREKIPEQIEKREGGYVFINPLLECGPAREQTRYWDYRKVRREIEAYVKEAVHTKRLTTGSVYFRDLNNGPSFGVNSEEKFSPASMLKVPLMIAYLKMAESRPALLKKQLVFDEKRDLNRAKHFEGSSAIKPGKGYPVEELIRMMVVNSDNNAMKLLFDHLDKGFREKVYRDLGIVDETGTGEFIMTVEKYAFCYRVLFNASYLNRDLSEQALRYLSQQDFPQGIIRGVPSGIPVAQKYGERLYANDVKELHDCGIVYHTKMPYLLCVMTRGADYYVLADALRDVSAITYKAVSGHHDEQHRRGSK